MKVSYFQYQNGPNDDDINGCGLFLIIIFCNFVLGLLLPHDTRQVLYKDPQNYKVGQLFPITKWGKIITKWGSSKITKWGKKNTKWGKIAKMGIRSVYNIRL